MSNEIIIDDLANPTLTTMQRSAFDYADTLTIELSHDAIMKNAEEKVGLNDWGAQDFIERLRLICDTWRNDNELTNLGRLSLYNKLLRHACSRLLIQHEFNQHPEIHDIEIEKPIIVAGLPRSGTTHLVNLMASDSRLRALPYWEAYEPVLRLDERDVEGDVDPRYQRADDEWESIKLMVPHVAAMHPMNPDMIHEEIELMGPNFGSYNYEWLAYTPSWRDYYLAEDQTYQYEYMRDVLKLLTWQARDTGAPTRWVLKCPQHLEQLPALFNVFPDAVVAITHRDPVSAIQSAITMLAYGQRISRKKVLIDELQQYWTARIKALLTGLTRDHANVPQDRIVDVPFHVMIEDDISMVEKIYEKAGLPLTSQARDELANFVDEHKGAYGRVKYDLQGQFGVDPKELSKQFDFYYDNFPVKRQFT